MGVHRHCAVRVVSHLTNFLLIGAKSFVPKNVSPMRASLCRVHAAGTSVGTDERVGTCISLRIHGKDGMVVQLNM